MPLHISKQLGTCKLSGPYSSKMFILALLILSLGSSAIVVLTVISKGTIILFYTHLKRNDSDSLNELFILDNMLLYQDTGKYKIVFVL